MGDDEKVGVFGGGDCVACPVCNSKVRGGDAACLDIEEITRMVVEKVGGFGGDCVACPVCNSKVRGGDAAMSSHLDVCLKRGVKRKLTQRTLLQWNFCSQSIAPIPNGQLEQVNPDVMPGFSCSEDPAENLGNGLQGFNKAEARINPLFELRGCEESSLEDCIPGTNKKVNNGGNSNLFFPSSSSLNASECEVVSECDDGGDNRQSDTSSASSEDQMSLHGMVCKGFGYSSEDNHVIGFEKIVADEKLDYNIASAATKDVHSEASIACSNDNVYHAQDNCAADLSSSSPRSGLSETSAALTVDDIVGAALDTFVVGRKFSSEKDVDIGATISLSRDPDNPRDPNAIKVLLADSFKELGFISRELAQHLSPLIEKFPLEFEGFVTSAPKNSLDVLPIRILCRKVMPHNNMDHDTLEMLTYMWKNLLLVVESGKSHSSSSTKYQQNFLLLIQEVLKSNHQLFTDEERKFIESFSVLPDDSQRLFIRLHMRKGPWFRMLRITYTEVTDAQQAVKQLSEAGYLHLVQGIGQLQKDWIKEILNLLTVPELREIASMFKKSCATSTRKQDLIESLFSAYSDGLCPSLPSLVLDRAGTCILISSKAKSLVRRTERLFFLDEEQDLSAFLLADLGIIKYPAYRCIVSKQIFSSRTDLLAYEEAIELAEQMEESLEKNSSESVFRCIEIAESWISSSPSDVSLPVMSRSCSTFHSRFTASWIYAKVLFLGIKFLEREHRYKDSIKLLKQLLACFSSDGRRGRWMLRLSIDLEHVGCPNESLLVAEEALRDPWIRSGSRMALQRRILRLGKPPRRWKLPSFAASVRRKIREVHIQGRPLNSTTGVKSRFYGHDGDQCGVEQLALEYYAGEGGGWQGVHTESGIWLTIFGLLMWEVIFSDVPDVFHNRFQTAPLDFGTDSFYLARETLIETHLQKIYNGMAEEILVTSWQLHLGTACRGVNWDRHSLSELRAAVTCTGGPCLASLCRHLAQDYRSWSSGMPDLLIWRFHGEYKGEAKLVEVKGPRDTLSEQQRAWLLLLMDCGFDAEVCKVSALPVSAKHS